MENYFDSQESEQQIDIKDYLRVIYRGRFIILFSFIAVLSITAYITFTSKPVYQATATVLVESQASMERALFDVSYLSSRSTLLTNQVEILKSRSLAKNVVLQLESKPYRDSLAIFQPNSDGNYLSLREQINWIMEHLTVQPKPDADIIEITFSAGSAFEAAEICNVIAQTFQEDNKDYNRREFRELRQFLEIQLNRKGEELSKSEELLKDFQEREKLLSLDESTRELVARMTESQSALEATQVSLEAALEQKRNLEKQLDDRRQSLASEVTQISSPLLAGLQQEYARLVSEKVRYETLIAQDQTINPGEYQLQLNSMGSRIKALQRRLEEEAQRIATTTMVSDPLVVAQELITSVLKTDTEIKGFRAKIEALQEIVEEYEAQLSGLPGQGLELARLQRQVQVDQNIYILLTEKLEETQIAEAGQRETIRVVDNAIEPTSPISPKKRLNLLLGVIIGLGLGVGLTFLIEYFDDSIKNPEELERLGFPILSIIPEISPDEIQTKSLSQNGREEVLNAQSMESRLITHFDPKSPISEAYRTLRTNLQFQKLNSRESTLLVTSSTPKEGKSTTIANLAITMAQMGSKTLLVDTDLRRPVIHSIFNLKKEKGLTNYLVGKMSFEEVLKATVVDNLYAISSGPLPPNPSEMISSTEMDRFIQKAKENFDVVLFDSPPIIAVTDAAVLSTKVGGLILVIRAHQTHKNAIQRAKNLLDNVNANILGCLLNGVNIEKAYGSYYYYYYYHYYSYYGGDLKRRKKSKAV